MGYPHNGPSEEAGRVEMDRRLFMKKIVRMSPYVLQDHQMTESTIGQCANLWFGLQLVCCEASEAPSTNDNNFLPKTETDRHVTIFILPIRVYKKKLEKFYYKCV